MLKRYLTILCLAISVSGCDFLDLEEATGITKKDAYEFDFANISKLVGHVYSQVPQDFGVLGSGALREAATDNAIFTWSQSNVYNIYNDIWSPKTLVDDAWDPMYTAVRSANSFLENFSIEKLERYQWNTDYPGEIKRAKGYVHEVRLLRAWFYFELIKRYGAVPLLKGTTTVEDVNSLPKTSFDDVVKFIVEELDEVAPLLPIWQKKATEDVPADQLPDYGVDDLGRVTRGTAMALKSRVLLYAASKLHNPTGDKTKWEAAAKAAYDVIETGWYSMPSIGSDVLYSKFGHDILTSPQLIYARLNGESNSFEARNMPFGLEGSQGGTTPSQNLMDAYEMKADGAKFDWDNEDHLKGIYTKRDPRMMRTIYYNGVRYGTATPAITIQTFEGGIHGLPIEGATLSGYYLRKGINPSATLSPVNPQKRPHHYIEFRYAEILLNYAEAMTEWQGPDQQAPQMSLTGRQALNMVRTAATMPEITDNGPEFVERLRNERRVELAFEDHRFWDIRRWKIGEVVKEIYGVKIKKTDDGYSYERVKIQDRQWLDKMYLYPIAQSEVFKNTNLTQNPGW